MSERKITLEVLCLMHDLRPLDLAAALDVSPSLVTRWFDGTRGLTVERMRVIAQLIDEPVGEVRKAYNTNALPRLVVAPIEPDESGSESRVLSKQPAVA